MPKILLLDHSCGLDEINAIYVIGIFDTVEAARARLEELNTEARRKKTAQYYPAWFEIHSDDDIREVHP